MPDATLTSPGPRISVVVPVYNGEATLEECLRRLCEQTLARDDYEVIVIDDGSTDATPEIAAHHPVRLIRQDNAGRIAARNRGAREAKSELIAFCDMRVFVEPDVLETAVGANRTPLMMGSDFPDEQQSTLAGRFFFCVYRRLWKPYYPQEWHEPMLAVDRENFHRAPKGTTFFVCERDFWLRHQPERTDRHTNDDTLLFESMIREKPIWRCSDLRCHYQQRTRLREVLPHAHHRGVRFSSYYLRPGKPFLGAYLACWAVLAALVIAAVALPRYAWVLPGGLVAAWVGVSAVWATSLRNFGAVLAMLPLMVAAFGSGIVRGHFIELHRTLGRGERSGGKLASLVSWAVLAGVIALAVWYLRGNWHIFAALAEMAWWVWPVAALPLAGVAVLNGVILRSMVRELGVRLRASEWLSLSFMTNLGNLLGPTRFGLLLRSVYLKRRGLALSHFLSTLGGSYVLATLAQMSAAAIGLATLYASGRTAPWPLPTVVALGLLVSLVLALRAPTPPAWLRERARPVANMLDGWRQIAADRKLLRGLFLCFVGNVVCGTLLFWLLYRQLGGDIPFGAALTVYGVGGIVSLIAITPGALGFFDFTAVATGAVFGIDADLSAAVMLVFRAVETGMNLLLGTLASGYLLRAYRRMGAEAAA